jgi:hypothetical protein
MSTITTSTTFRNLKATIDNVITDKNDNLEKNLVFPKYLPRETMEDNYVDDVEVGGPGLATEKAEAQMLDVGQLSDGYLTRYYARKFGLQMIVSEEALEDGKYSNYIDAAKRIKRSLFKAMEFDAANVLNRAADTNYIGGDGLCLANSAHTIAAGGTFSNTLATPFSPSRAALIVVAQNVMQLPGHDGNVEGYMPTKVVCPVSQWGAWSGILGSEKVPESNNNEINVIKSELDLELVPVKYWTGSTTNWAVLTDAPDGLKWKDRRKPKSRSWVDNNVEALRYSVSARWARGWSDPRGLYFSNS